MSNDIHESTITRISINYRTICRSQRLLAQGPRIEQKCGLHRLQWQGAAGSKLKVAAVNRAVTTREAYCLPCRIGGFSSELLHVNFDLPRFALLRFWHADFENAVFVGSFDAIRFRGLGQ